MVGDAGVSPRLMSDNRKDAFERPFFMRRNWGKLGVYFGVCLVFIQVQAGVCIWS